MKFKKGDSVRIVERIHSSLWYPGGYIDEMTKYAGKTAMVLYVRGDFYDLDIDKGKWSWSDSMLKAVRKPTKSMKTKQKTECETFDHDFKHLKRYGRADWRCPNCDRNVTLLLVFAKQADIDLTK